jgi:hypothetical protein
MTRDVYFILSQGIHIPNNIIPADAKYYICHLLSNELYSY